MIPPGVQPTWDANGVDAKAALIAYSQLREYEETDLALKPLAALAGAK